MRSAKSSPLRAAVVGLILALPLTAVPFALVAWGGLNRVFILAVIALSAVLQAVVHLRCFLGIDVRDTPRRNLVALAFATVLIVLMIGGSLWIMFDLHRRMM